MPHAPRLMRDCERVRRAAAAARDCGTASAMDIALAQIGAVFDEAAAINDFKIRVERFLQLSPHHPAVQARFGARATLLAERSLEESIACVERWWRDERKAFQVASALGCGNRLSLEVLRELRLILRLMRFKHLDAEYCAIAAVRRDQTTAVAAG